MKDAVIDAHNKYDGMNFDELVVQLIPNHVAAGGDFEIIKAALRKAVIREATLTIAVVKTQEYEDEITAPKGSPDRIVTMSQNVGLRGYVPDGEYYLIKKEAT
jgi:hypothetical protein